MKNPHFSSFRRRSRLITSSKLQWRFNNFISLFCTSFKLSFKPLNLKNRPDTQSILIFALFVREQNLQNIVPYPVDTPNLVNHLSFSLTPIHQDIVFALKRALGASPPDFLSALVLLCNTGMVGSRDTLSVRARANSFFFFVASSKPPMSP